MSSEKDSPEGDDLDISTAADDPTAVWDEAALRSAGLNDFADAPPAPVESAPATQPAVQGGNKASVVVSVAPQPRNSLGPALKPSLAPPPPAAKKQGGGLTWPVTFLLAAFLFAAVFVLVRALR